MTKKHKAALSAGRKAYFQKRREGMVEDSKPIKVASSSPSFKIIGYSRDKGDSIPYPVFSSERRLYSGKIFATVQEARGGR
jgi:hypothetical protein